MPWNNLPVALESLSAIGSYEFAGQNSGGLVPWNWTSESTITLLGGHCLGERFGRHCLSPEDTVFEVD